MAGFSKFVLRLCIASFILTGFILFARPAGAAPPSAGVVVYLPIVQRNNSTICGEILTDTIWTAEQGPYLITCDAVVTNTVTLTITAGTQVWFEHPTDDFLIFGNLHARGTAAAPIYFQPANGTTPGSWGKLAFEFDGSHVLDHVILEYGGSYDSMIYIGGEVQILNSVVRYSGSAGIGIEFGDPLISGTQILSNTGTYAGGGIFSDSPNMVLQNNTFAGNTCTRPSCSGGALAIANSPTIQGNTFIGNSADYGGGIDIGPGSPLIENNIFINNHASLGGGLYIDSGSPIVRNNTFVHNTANGSYGNLGGGLYINSGTPSVYNNIVVDNTAEGGGGGIYNSGGTIFVDYNDVWNNTGGNYFGASPGVHDISADPRLVNPANGDFHLTAGSPCIDTGDPLNYPPTDFERDVRPYGAAPDIGADEYESGGVQ